MEVCHWRQPLAASVVSSAFLMCRSMPWWATGVKFKPVSWAKEDTQSRILVAVGWMASGLKGNMHLVATFPGMYSWHSLLHAYLRGPLSNGCLVLAFMSRFAIWDSFSPNFMTSVGLFQGTGLSQTYLSAGMLLSQTYSTVLESHTVPLSFPSHRCQDTGIIPEISHCTWSHPTNPEYWDYPRHTLLYWVSHSPTVLLPIP